MLLNLPLAQLAVPELEMPSVLDRLHNSLTQYQVCIIMLRRRSPHRFGDVEIVEWAPGETVITALPSRDGRRPMGFTHRQSQLIDQMMRPPAGEVVVFTE